MVKYFSTEAEYLAAAKVDSESNVFFVGENNESKFDGSNVVVGLCNAKTGDAVILDANKALHIIPRETYNNANIPSGFTKVGVVVIGVDHEDFRGDVAILYGESAAQNKVWSYIYSFRLTGYTLDGTDRSGKLTIYTASSTQETFTIAYNASDLDSFISQLNAFFRDTANTVFQTQDWVAVKNGDAVDLQFHFTFGNQRSNSGSSGFSLSANLLPEITASNAMLRINGTRLGEGSILNWDRALVYFRADNSSASYNPTSNVTTTKLTSPICLPAYLGQSSYRKDGDTQLDYCSLLRSTYGEGEAGWLKFMATFFPVRPTTYGPMGDKKTYGDGKTNTYKMAGRMWTGQSGTQVAAFPAADYCANVAFNHELLKKGCWFMPDIDQLTSIIKTVKYNTTNDRNADVINQTLYAMGFSALSNGTNAWSASRSDAAYAWFFRGSNGYAGCYTLFNAHRALPVVLLTAR